MKNILLFAFALFAAQLGLAQTKSFTLYAVAEGNFGTPNGDVFKVTKGNDTAVINGGAQWQTANNTTVGFDVLQDFQIAGNRAVFVSKSSSSRIAIANFPSFDSVHTFSITGGQCMGKASGTKVYVSYAQGNTIKLVDLVSNTLTTVSDPTSQITSYASHMIGANGAMYVAIGAKIVKIDTATNTVTGSIQPGLGAIAGMQADSSLNAIWLLGKSGTTSALIKMDVTNNDFLNPAIVLTGVTNAAQLRYANSKLYFLSGKNVHIYNITTPNIPTASVYTSTLGGTAAGFAYGKAFAVDPVSGDFAIGSANGYASASLYEVVDGTTFTQIKTGAIPNCKIVNELTVSTGPAFPVPVPNTSPLPNIVAQCGVALTPPTATAGTTVITGTTTAPLTYSAQGSYTVTWTYANANGTATQTQNVTIADTIAPVADVQTLPNLTGTCPYTITAIPTATDNCLGSLTATTTDPLTYTTGGTYTVNWTYTDSNANVTTQTQTVVVDCSSNAVAGTQTPAFITHIQPNPANSTLHIQIETAGIWTLSMTDVMGKEVARVRHQGKDFTLPVADLMNGVYFITLRDVQSNHSAVSQKVIVQH